MEGEDQPRREVDETVNWRGGTVPFTLLVGLSVDLKRDLGDGLADYCQLRAVGLNKVRAITRSYQKETGIGRDQVHLQHLFPKDRQPHLHQLRHKLTIHLPTLYLRILPSLRQPNGHIVRPPSHHML